MFVPNIYNLALTLSVLLAFNIFLLLGITAYLKLNNELFTKISLIFSAMVIFESLLSFGQWLRRSTYGLSIEAVNQGLTYFKGPAQDYFSVRSLGTFSHPNELALFSLGMSLFFLPMIFKKNNKSKLKKIYQISFIAAISTLILSLGRSAWISFVFCFLLFLFILEKKWKRKVILVKNIRTKNVLYIIVLLAIFLIIIFPRLLKMTDLFKPEGGGETRIKLINEVINVIGVRPFFGTGTGLSGYFMFKFNPKGIVSTFPTTVHNLYLKIASESGIPALMFFLLVILFWFRNIFFKFKKLQIKDKIKLLSAILPMLGYLLNGIMQQIFLFSFFIIYLMLGSIDYANKKD
ncbi:O-antigen ligase family protein [Patescibacteria group bacterium]